MGAKSLHAVGRDIFQMEEAKMMGPHYSNESQHSLPMGVGNDKRVDRNNKASSDCSVDKLPAKKWGDTEIAERGRSVLVMRARYRSAGLTLHQRWWTDAG